MEIYVSNSPKQENEDTLLPTASMMTFSEMNSNVNTNRLRFFGMTTHPRIFCSSSSLPLLTLSTGPDKLTKGVSDKAWKYLRIVCMSFDTSRRPFGLARVRLFHSPPPSHYVASAVADNRSSMTTSPSSQPLPTCAPQKVGWMRGERREERGERREERGERREERGERREERGERREERGERREERGEV